MCGVETTSMPNHTNLINNYYRLWQAPTKILYRRKKAPLHFGEPAVASGTLATAEHFLWRKKSISENNIKFIFCYFCIK